MGRARLFLFITAVLFSAWIGWLAYLAFTTTRPIILSRPQFLASQVDIIGQVRETEGRPDAKVVVDEVAWARDAQFKPALQATITVANLPRITSKEGWNGPGRYILPLIKEGDEYLLASIPSSPGFGPSGSQPRIYRDTPQTRAQLQEIRRPK